MLQIVDISQTISLNEKIHENEMLEIINATTSHELRNPLNSLIAQNFKKNALYEEIKEICDKNNYTTISSIIGELKTCSKVQTSSAKIMSFLV